MVLCGDMSIEAAVMRVPVKKGTGRPRKSRSGLDKRGSYWSKESLANLFIHKPATPWMWSIAKTFTFEENGEIVHADVAGYVYRHINRNGTYMWTVKFVDGDDEEMNAEELAEVIVYSKQLGVDVDAPRLLVKQP